MRKGFLIGLILVSLAASRAPADVRLPTIFGDNMVLQRDLSLPVWGWADPGEKVTVSLAGQSKSASADAKGAWSLKLDPLKADDSGLTLTVAGKNRIELKNVLIGEVWLCSGQSNMAMSVGGAVNGPEEIAAANFPKMRLYSFPQTAAAAPQAETKGAWAVCSPQTIGKFSATGFFFGRELHKTLNVPVGLINSSWGGTAIEAWTSREGHLADPELKKRLEAGQLGRAPRPDKGKKAAPGKENAGANQGTPSALFNGMINPLIPFGLRGAIWYQGEANSHAGRGELYRRQLPAMITDWRKRWGQGDFPFLWVQLPNFKARRDDPNAPSEWALNRESMLKTLQLANTAMAITIDIGEEKNIHPKNKQDVGKRLAIGALKIAYGKDVCPMGPIFESAKVEGGKVRVTFTCTDGGLVAKGGELKGFAVAGADRKFVWAKADIEGSAVVVSSDKVAKPAAVRYAWGDNPDCNLYNKDGLPASPFRTDDWPAGEEGR